MTVYVVDTTGTDHQDREAHSASASVESASDTPWFTIDSHRPYSEGGIDAGPTGRHDYLGGLEWTRAAYAYFGPMVPHAAAERIRAWREWWTNADVCAGLRAHLNARLLEQTRAEPHPEQLLPSPMLERAVAVQAEQMLEAVIAIASGSESVHEVASRMGRSVPWMQRERRLLVRVVRTEYLPYTEPRRPPRRRSAPAGTSSHTGELYPDRGSSYEDGGPES